MFRLWHRFRPTGSRAWSTEVGIRPPTLRKGRKGQSDALGWESVVGLEVHAQISAASKLFSAASAQPLAPVNTQVALFDASIPGTLPVINQRCVEAAVQTALALNCQINKVSTFDRKHYFYADLPTGYQITQQRQAVAVQGHLDFTVLRSPTVPQSYQHRVGITQLQLEQDSGKSLHDDELKRSLIDLNRCGVGLMEIVFEPHLSNGEEAGALVKELSLILQKLGVCSGKMEEGALRVDANISVNRPGDPLGIRTEVKNLNSVRAVMRSIEYEVGRQISVLESGGIVENETRSFSFETKQTMPMRDKEGKQDYRFMPEPNLPPLRLCDNGDNERVKKSRNVLNIDDFRAGLPELPEVTRRNLMAVHNISLDSACRLMYEPVLLDFFLQALESAPKNPQILANLLHNSVPEFTNALGITVSEAKLTPSQLVELANIKEDDELPHNIILKALQTLIEEEYPTAEQLIAGKNWRNTVRNMETIARLVDEVIQNEPKLVKKFLKGKDSALVALAKSIGKTYPSDIDMKLVTRVLKDTLDKMK